MADRPEQIGKPAIAGRLALLSASDYICTHILRSCFKNPVSNFLRKNFKQLLIVFQKEADPKEILGGLFVLHFQVKTLVYNDKDMRIFPILQ